MIRLHVTRTIIGLAIGFLLYRKLLLSVPVAVIFLAFSLIGKNREREKKKSLMTGKFREFLICLEPVLGNTGTFSSAYSKAVKDYENMHGNDDLLPILKAGISGFSMNKSTGEVLGTIAEKIKAEDAYIFAGSVETSEETGGSVMEITRHSIGILSEKIRLKRDIEVVLSGKKMEHLLVSLIPVVILILLSAGTGSYLSPLYETGAGRIVMTGAGIVFGSGWLAGRKITEIEV